jgi:PAS domain S-box-containing protein
MNQHRDSLKKYSIDNEIIKLLLEHSALGIVICDKFENIIESNRFVCNLLGVEKEKLISKKFSHFFSIINDSSQSLNSSMATMLLKDSMANSKIVKISFSNKEGEALEFQSHIYKRILGDDLYLLCLFDSFSSTRLLNNFLEKYSSSICTRNGGEEKYLCNTMSDLLNMNLLLSKEVNKTSDLKKNIESALEREKKHSEFKTRFVSIASHELRTPLGGILTSASLLEKYNIEGSPEQRKKHIDIIKGQVRILTSILDDFLSLDRLDQPEVRVHLKKFSLHDFFSDFMKSFNEYRSDRDRLFYRHIGDGESIYQDSDLLLKIINNLVSNGLKYSSKDKIVNITSEVVGNMIVIKVKDQGIGIPEGEKDSIWDLFYRCENTSGIQGTGLGLNIANLCSHLIEGSISFNSTKNFGSEFVLSFPKELCV